MMKNLILLILLLLPFGMKADKIKDYYRLIHQAELAHISEDFQLSEQYYSKALEMFRNPVAKDVVNAMLNAHQAQVKQSFFKYATVLSQYGLSSDFFTENPLLTNWKDTQEWIDLLKFTQLLYEQKLEQNKKLNTEIDSLQQEVRYWLFYAIEDDRQVKEFKEFSKELYLYLNKLFQERGLLTEQDLGLVFKGDYSLAYPKIFELIEFTYLTTENFIEFEFAISKHFDPYLKEAYQQGKINWDFFWRCYSNPQKYEVFFPRAVYDTADIVIGFFSKEDMEKIEDDRSMLGLWGLKDQFTKINAMINRTPTIILSLNFEKGKIEDNRPYIIREKQR